MPRGSAARLVSVATQTPGNEINFETAVKFAKRMSCDNPSQHRTVDALYRRTRIKSRGSVLIQPGVDPQSFFEFYQTGSDHPRGPTTAQRAQRYMTEAPLLAVPAARAAIDSSEFDAARVTHLVTVSCTGFTAPGVDIELIRQLDLPATTQRVQVGFMGCHGAVNALRVARGLVAADPDALVLVVSVELCSLHYQYGFDPDRIVSGALFADGAAAVLVAGDDMHYPTASSSLATPMTAELVATGSCWIPDSEDEMTWRIGDHGYEMTLSSRVPELIRQSLPEYLQQFLEPLGETINSIGGWAVHPGGPRILSAVEACLDLPSDALSTSREILTNHGNMSSATMLFILQRFIQRQQPGPWLMLGFGPGLEIEVALIR